MAKFQFSYFESALNRLNPFAPGIDRAEKLIRILPIAIIFQLAYSVYYLTSSRVTNPVLISGFVQLFLVLSSSILLIRHIKAGWYIAMFVNIYNMFIMAFKCCWLIPFINKYYSNFSGIVKISKEEMIIRAIINYCVAPAIIGALIFWFLSIPEVRKRLKINNTGYVVTISATILLLLCLFAASYWM